MLVCATTTTIGLILGLHAAANHQTMKSRIWRVLPFFGPLTQLRNRPHINFNNKCQNKKHLNLQTQKSVDGPWLSAEAEQKILWNKNSAADKFQNKKKKNTNTRAHLKHLFVLKVSWCVCWSVLCPLVAIPSFRF